MAASFSADPRSRLSRGVPSSSSEDGDALLLPRSSQAERFSELGGYFAIRYAFRRTSAFVQRVCLHMKDWRKPAVHCKIKCCRKNKYEVRKCLNEQMYLPVGKEKFNEATFLKTRNILQTFLLNLSFCQPIQVYYCSVGFKLRSSIYAFIAQLSKSVPRSSKAFFLFYF